jgi:hypothetical protein
MSAVLEIKRAASRLSSRQKLALAEWLRAKAEDRLSDETLMEIAAEGARRLDHREAAHAKRKARRGVAS